MQFAAYNWREVNLTGDRDPQKVQTFQISANLFGHVSECDHNSAEPFFPRRKSPAGSKKSFSVTRSGSSDTPIRPSHRRARIVKVDGKAYTVVGVMAKGLPIFRYPPKHGPRWLSTSKRV